MLNGNAFIGILKTRRYSSPAIGVAILKLLVGRAYGIQIAMAQKRTCKELEPGVRDQQASLYNLFKNGIPTTKFVRDEHPTTARSADHLLIGTDSSNSSDSSGDLSFGVLANFDQLLNEAGKLA